MAELLIVSMLEPYTLNKPFTSWPRHITIMPWFTASVDQVEPALSKLSAQSHPVTCRVGKDALFGMGATVVQLISDNGSIASLHRRLLSLFQVEGININGRYTGEQFKPHIRVKHGQKLLEGTPLVINHIQVAESLPQSYRKIIADYTFRGAPDE